MDAYAPAYVAHNVPLLVVSGLGSAPRSKSKAPEGATRITSEIPPVESEDAQALLRHFKDSDAGELAWNAREYSGRNKFRVKTVGRVVSTDSVIVLSVTEA
jgi:trafficking protein particle complex subunit 11